LLSVVIEGRMEEKMPKGRPRNGMLGGLTDEKHRDMKGKTENPEKWRS